MTRLPALPPPCLTAQFGFNAIGYLLLRFTRPRYLPLTAPAAAAAPPAEPQRG